MDAVITMWALSVLNGILGSQPRDKVAMLNDNTTEFCLRNLHEVGLTEGGGGSYFPYILLNEIQTMFSQLAKRSAKVLPADLCTDYVHYVKNHR